MNASYSAVGSFEGDTRPRAFSTRMMEFELLPPRFQADRSSLLIFAGFGLLGTLDKNFRRLPGVLEYGSLGDDEARPEDFFRVVFFRVVFFRVVFFLAIVIVPVVGQYRTFGA